MRAHATSAWICGALALAGVVSVEAARGQEPASEPLRVPPSSWERRVAAGGVMPHADFPLPAGAVERILLARELDDGDPERTPRLRDWLERLSVIVTCSFRQERVEGERRWVAVACVPELEGSLGLEVADDDVYCVELAAPEVERVQDGFAWTARLRVSTDGGARAYDLDLSGEVALGAPDVGDSRFTLRFAGPRASRVEATVPGSSWREAQTARYPRATFAPPPGLVERILVDRERRGGNPDITPSLRLLLAQVRVLAVAGAEQRDVDGELRWTLTGLSLSLDGIQQGHGGGATFAATVSEPEVTSTGAGSCTWTGRQRLELDGHVYHVRLSGEVALGAGEGEPHQLRLVWEGPLLPD